LEYKVRFLFNRGIGTQHATRFGAAPEHKNTFVNYIPPSSSEMYINEEERFKGVGDLNRKTFYQKKEKEEKDYRYSVKLLKIKRRQKEIMQSIYEQTVKKENNDKEKIKAMFKRRQTYEDVNVILILEL